jgi:uncharacterized protein YybS (DUF2232 family)
MTLTGQGQSAPAPSGAGSPREGASSEPRLGGILGAGLVSALLFSASLLVPFLFLLGMASPLPLALQRLRGGLSGALLSGALAAGLLAAAFTPGQGVAFVLVLALPGLLIGEAMARGRGLLRGCAWAFLVLSAEISLALLLASGPMSENFLQPLEQFRSPQFLEDLKASGLPPEKVTDWTDQMTTLRAALAVVFPAAYIIAGGLIVLLNGALLRLYLLRRDPGWLEDGEFERVRFPLVLAASFVLSGAAVLVEPLRAAAYNALLVQAFFFGLQGLAVVTFYARRLAGPPFLRAVVVVLVLANPWAVQILALLGLFDNWIDFRKWAEPPETRGA